MSSARGHYQGGPRHGRGGRHCSNNSWRGQASHNTEFGPIPNHHFGRARAQHHLGHSRGVFDRGGRSRAHHRGGGPHGFNPQLQQFGRGVSQPWQPGFNPQLQQFSHGGNQPWQPGFNPQLQQFGQGGNQLWQPGFNPQLQEFGRGGNQLWQPGFNPQLQQFGRGGNQPWQPGFNPQLQQFGYGGSQTGQPDLNPQLQQFGRGGSQTGQPGFNPQLQQFGRGGSQTGQPGFNPQLQQFGRGGSQPGQPPCGANNNEQPPRTPNARLPHRGATKGSSRDQSTWQPPCDAKNNEQPPRTPNARLPHRGATRGSSRDQSTGQPPCDAKNNEQPPRTPNAHLPHRGATRGSSRAQVSQNWRQKNKQDNHTIRPTSPQNIQAAPTQYMDFPFLVEPDVVRLLREFKVMMILRGISGSGKSTVAAAIMEKYGDSAVICSADSFRYNAKGEYVWSKYTLSATHEKCKRHARQSCDSKKALVVIDNTNVEYFELEPYIQLAKNSDYIVVLVEPRTPWKFDAKELREKSSHDILLKIFMNKVEKFEDINPLYFAWFMSPKYCSEIKKCAVDILKSCFKIAQFRNWLAQLSRKGVSNYFIKDAMHYYYMSKFNQLHVTSCFCPRERSLGLSPYSKSHQVLDSLGNISTITVIGWVLTEKSFSARVALTKRQEKLWHNEDLKPDLEMPTGLLGNMKIEDDGSLTNGREMFLKPSYGRSATTHVTVGLQTNAKRVQAKHDQRTVVDHELGHSAHTQYDLDDGIVRNYAENTWVVYLTKPVKGPAIFSGYYE